MVSITADASSLMIGLVTVESKATAVVIIVVVKSAVVVPKLVFVKVVVVLISPLAQFRGVRELELVTFRASSYFTKNFKPLIMTQIDPRLRN